MMRKFMPLILLMLIPAMIFAATNHKSPRVNARDITAPILRGDEPIMGRIAYPPYGLPRGLDEVDLIGDTTVIGMTWYENQHNGTIGRMLDVSGDGYVHLGWMKGYAAEPATRHVWYNAWDLAGGALVFADGIAIDNSSSRGGFITLDANESGVAFPAFHQVTAEVNPHSAVAFDLAPHLGAFTAIDIPWLYDEFGSPMEIIWPHMMMSQDESVMHVVSTEYVASAGSPQRQFYTPAVYDPISYMITYPELPDSALRMIGWTMTIAGDVATSPVSDRTIFAWAYPLSDAFPPTANQIDNDIYVLIDDDGQDFHFEDYFNLTNFFPPDPSWFPDTSLALMDTLRVYTDLNVFMDQDDYAHVVFTTRHYDGIDSTSYWHTSIIWHWTEQYPNDIRMIHNAFDDWWEGWYPGGVSGWGNVYCGAWNVKAQRPELAQDPETGYLYCMYQVYDCDTTRLSHFAGSSGWGMPSGEIYMSVSTDGGLSWGQGINVTNTLSPDQAPAGQCLSELTPSLARATANGFAHVEYVLDLDAGNVIQTEGDATDNPVIYHRVPLDSIPLTPLVPQWPEPGGVPFHVEQAPTIGIPGAGKLMQPKEFGLKQNYPNPFNPITSITFSLDQVSEVTLDVFNLKGELVANVASGTYGTGEHMVSFDASAFASGMYFYKLQAGQRSLERKMLLLK